jgi:hypothetical protein
MKALKFVVFGIVLLFAGAAQAQVTVRFGPQPRWAPVGYDDVRYYYLPDVEAYYDVQSSMFIYSSGNKWVHKRSLPSRYKSYDLYGGYKVPMKDYRGNAPYSNFNQHRTQYTKGYHGEPQKTIGQRPVKGNSKKMKNNRDNNR